MNDDQARAESLDGGSPRRDRRYLWLLLLLLLALAGGGILLLTGPDHAGEPAPEEKPGAAPPPVPPGAGPAAGGAHVVLLTVVAEDELDLVITKRSAPSPADTVYVLEEAGEPPVLVLGPEAIEAMEEGVAVPDLLTGVERLDDLRVVVIERVAYEGRGRHGVRARVALGRELPGPEQGEAPAEVRLAPDGGLEALDAILPRPEDFSWSLEDGALVVCGERLEAGGEVELPAAQARVRVVETRYRDIPLGETPEDPFATEEEDHGAVLFRARMLVRYLGEIEVREEER